MNQWEYATVRLVCPDGMADKLAAMGAAGWELAVSLNDPTKYATLVFKRTVSETRPPSKDRKVQRKRANLKTGEGVVTSVSDSVESPGVHVRTIEATVRVPRAQQEPLTEQMAR